MPESSPEETGPAPQSIAAGASDFDLLSRVDATAEGNKMVSKTSLDAVLNILALGTSDTSLMDAILAYTGLDAGEDLSQQLREAAECEDPETVKAANGIWVDETHGLKEDFQTQAKQLGVNLSGFSDPQAAMDDINQFVDVNTNRMIPKVIDSPASIQDMVLVNTLYFDGKWVSPFESEATFEEPFTRADGTEQSVNFMHQEAGSLYETKDWLAWSLPYEGDTYEFVAILPADESKLTFDYSELDLEALLAAETGETVYVSLPKFSFDWESSLDDVLKASGLSGIYDDGSFDAIMDVPANVSTVFQKTRVELDEDGTKAAAATVVMLQTTSLELEEPRSLRFDRPFLFVIRNTKTGRNLFTGLVNLPVES